ncbi:MAG: DUF899 domain-containing protein [Acidimicrobiia bacterium]|nr:DUF899 domain-containing protein [Acidimicrobiia bacterium]
MAGAHPTRPPVVTLAEWEEALAELTAKEKALTRQGDALSAERRRLPMVAVEGGYRFEGQNGTAALLDLFEGRRQLIVYHFMFAPEQEEGCEGCSWVVDAMSHPAHLHARDTSLVLVSRAELDKIERYRRRMGWEVPWYSSFGTDFNADMGATVDGEENHGVSVFFRDGSDVFRTYATGDRGVEHLGSHWTYLDLTPFGRQESWEDSPPGWPRTEPYTWIRRHDAYAT